jgi:hypothetical protein
LVQRQSCFLKSGPAQFKLFTGKALSTVRRVQSWSEQIGVETAFQNAGNEPGEGFVLQIPKMKFEKIGLVWKGWRLLVLGALVFMGAGAGAAETNSVRLAIGPCFAPAGNPKLDEAAAAFPDLLTVSLSRDNRFQLVEREKANAVWSELHLTEAGLTSAATVARFGNILSCDWLISGSLVPSETGPQIWVKVIDTQSGVVLDLQSLPYNVTNFSATAGDIAQFLAQAGTRKQPREFIALERFQDASVGTMREDWTPRLSSLIEKYFLSAGYGVVERGTVAPIFSEYQFQSAGMTGDATRRVKLKPAFWVVSGNWKWFSDPQDKLSVTINVQKMGGGAQLINISKPPGPELARSLIEAIQSALKAAGSLTVEQAQAGEEKFLAEHTQELLKGRGETWTPPRFAANTPTSSVTVTNASGGQRRITIDPNWLAQQDSHKQEMFKSLQQSILLNPKDMRAKYLLGMALFGTPGDAVTSRQGEVLLEEVAKSGDPVYAIKAKNWLDDVRTGKISFKRDKFGNLQLETHGQPASLPKGAQNGVTVSRWAPTNPVVSGDSLKRIASPPAIGYFERVTAVKLWHGKVLVACDKTLQSFDPASRRTTTVKLPLNLNHGITAIEADDDNWWLGTDGDGLIRVSQKGGTPRVFTEKDGFPMPSISALKLAPGRLLIGFGAQSGGRGGFGFLDTVTEHFTSMMSKTVSRDPAHNPPQSPPELKVKAIATADGTNIWVGSGAGLQHLDLPSRIWSEGIPVEVANTKSDGSFFISVSSGFMAMHVFPMGRVAIRRLPDGPWTCVDLSTNYFEITGLTIDSANPELLWVVGNDHSVTILDMAAMKIVGKFSVGGPGSIEWMLEDPERVVCFAMGIQVNVYGLYCINKSALSGTSPKAEPTGEITARSHEDVLRDHFDRFVPVQFQKVANGQAAIQYLHVRENLFPWGERYYCGFKFTVPTWLDGDFEWMYALAKTEAEKDFFSRDMFWDIISESGPSEGFEGRVDDSVDEHPQLKRQLPYSHSLTIQHLAMNRLQPGKTYAIWFAVQEKNHPDIAFAMTIDSKRGATEFGVLPLFDSAPAPVVAKDPPTSAEQLQSELESAIKARDRNKLIGLVCWQDVPEGQKALFIEKTIGGWMDLEYVKVKVPPPSPVPNTSYSHEVNGIRNRPNIPVFGEVQVIVDKWGNSYSYPYGKVGNGFLISVYIREPATK